MKVRQQLVIRSPTLHSCHVADCVCWQPPTLLAWLCWGLRSWSDMRIPFVDATAWVWRRAGQVAGLLSRRAGRLQQVSDLEVHATTAQYTSPFVTWHTRAQTARVATRLSPAAISAPIHHFFPSLEGTSCCPLLLHFLFQIVMLSFCCCLLFLFCCPSAHRSRRRTPLCRTPPSGASTTRSTSSTTHCRLSATAPTSSRWVCWLGFSLHPFCATPPSSLMLLLGAP